MKPLIKFFEIFALIALVLAIVAPLARAADFGTDFAPVGNSPINQIQLHSVTVYMLIRIFGQTFAALKSGGGLKGIFNALLYGENAPRAVMQDYKAELGLTPVPTVGANGSVITAEPIVPPVPTPKV